MKKFDTEREGQLDFFERILPLVNPALDMDDILGDSNDGVINGNLLEFKLRITDLNATLFQAIKYLSARRIKGKPVPANILLVDLCAEQAYLYKSENYIDQIETVYYGGASKDDKGFLGSGYEKKYSYDEPIDAAELIETLRNNSFTKIHVDEDCIVGWAMAYYQAVPMARKEDFLGDDTGKHKTIGEIRNPTVFKDYILPYTGKTNVRFQYLMDKLNDTIQKKNLGAFYTPEIYAKKSHELLRDAIKRVPVGNDYVIIDRCAGTGNLEKELTDDELSHCILSTVEYYEYKVLQEVLGAKVRHIIPPIEAVDTFQAGLVRGANALEKDYIENPLLKKYIDNPKCTIILFENPPYAETTSVEHQRKKESRTSSEWKNSFVVTEMRKEIKGSALNDLGNAFIWSAFKYLLRQDTDSYVVYSPVKYWKAQHLIAKKFLKGFAFNRKHFHTNIDACIMCALWSNENDSKTESFSLNGYDIVDGNLVDCGLVDVKKIHSLYSATYYDKRKMETDSSDGILIGLNGLEKTDGKKRNKPVYNKNIIGYLIANTSGFDNPDLNGGLLVAGRYDGNGFYLRKDNYLKKLPMFCATRYITYNREWTERARIMKSADGAKLFEKDVDSGKLDQWLRKCLLFTCLEMHNHIRSLEGSDGRFYKNELCLDTTNGETLASVDLKALKQNESEKQLLEQWNSLLSHVKMTKEYKEDLTYGVYQIFDEIDISYKDEETGDIVWKNLEVHSDLRTLKELVKKYYNDEIVPTLFKYEFLK